MNDITVSKSNLPSNIDDLAKFALIGREKLVAVRAEIRAIEKVGLAQEVREQKLREAQDISEAVLDAEVRIGELMAKVPKATENQYTKVQSDSGVARQKPKADVIRDAGFTPKQVQRFQTLAAHPEIVEQAKAEARENDDIVSRSLVLNMVKAKKQEEKRQERQEDIQQQIAKPKTDNHVDIFTTDKKYRVIYADPPWSYNDRQDTGMLGGAVKHYTTMPLNDICDLPVPSADNAVLFMWVTSPLLEDSFKVINAWGFKYKSSFVWDKVAHNMGHYNSVRHEFLLIATKGSCTPDVKRLFDSVVSIERTEHSRKPKEFRDMIDTLYPIGNRLEMFAREAPDGWDVWGNMA
jgi:N6-adenosine-specific RNA methylase IME4